MKAASRNSVIAAALAFAGVLGSSFLLRSIDHVRKEQPLDEVLYIPSPQAVKRISLGYNGLMADIYWTRAVQYFGGKHHVRAMEYRLLAPLLDITTELDPHLIVAYEFGSIFLSQAPPHGAGDPAAAVRLVKRGIAENPEAWKLWYHLGFIYWMELHDSKLASEAFLQGSKVPGAKPWMRVMAAALAQNAGEAKTAKYLWTNILNSADDPSIRDNAVKRLIALQVDDEVNSLQEIVDRYKAQTGASPSDFRTLVSAGVIRRLPIDPLGHAFKLNNGRVEVTGLRDLPFITRGLPTGVESNVIPMRKAKTK